MNSKNTSRTANLDSSESICEVFPEITGFQIREFRSSKNMSQAQFARAYEIPLPTLKRWEGEKNTPRFSPGFRKILAEWLDKFRQRQPSISV